jgi:hypothetical protein
VLVAFVGQNKTSKTALNQYYLVLNETALMKYLVDRAECK